jgi:hypothetical protein
MKSIGTARGHNLCFKETEMLRKSLPTVLSHLIVAGVLVGYAVPMAMLATGIV